MEVADVNLDGNPDIISAYQSGIAVWLGDGKRENWNHANYGLPSYKYHYKVAIAELILMANQECNVG